ncbi:uncharacterized protein LOC120255343 [Dioscorea cayenensis subsp. rotundata]|uniref:Uncharacterized protein LOC120255343 n=1 Tax=Dioscorea cayennensis subsp. rotundata TaxID=55577 RepID=A0AB40AVW1_DIOCR|nr:uncharacterized protein LOC120255343 [Dioscorea cayenensis subsp. rotundata]
MQLLDAASGRSLCNKQPIAAYTLIEEMESNVYQWSFEGSKPVKALGILQDDVVTTLAAQVEAIMKWFDPMQSISSDRLPGSLPSNTKINLKESLTGVSLRSGKQLLNSVENEPKKEIKPSNIIDLEAQIGEKEKTMEQVKEKSAPPVFQPKLPYPMPRYAKFLKELLMNKRKLEDVSLVTLSGECSALITNSLPKKEKDPGGFIIPCTIGWLIDEKALADLGASINLMPYKIFPKLGLGESKPTPMTLQVANRSIRQP